MSSVDQDNAIGRRKSDNKELEDAPASSHVKRTAQESFAPEAFVLRRSMPWAEGMRGGLNFVAFGKSFDAFEAQLKKNGRCRRRHRRRAVQVYPAGFRKLFLVSADDSR